MLPATKDLIAYINDRLDGYLPDDSGLKTLEAVRYSVLKGESSRRRPLLMIMAAGLFDDNPVEAITPMACGVELYHTASLIIDDLPSMDNSQKRRGIASCHIEYGVDIAQLAAIELSRRFYDLALSSSAFDQKRVIEATRYIGRHIGLEGLVGGQELDLQNNQLTKMELLNLYQLKTAGFIGSIAAAPAILYGRKSGEKDALFSFGANVGFMLQMVDDLRSIDDESDRGKSTALTVFGRHESHKLMHKFRENAVKSLDMFGEKASFLIESVKELTVQNN